MINQEVDPQYIQMLESNAAKSTLCPLMKRTGNCLCKAQCPYDHTPAFKKNIEEIKQFVPSKGGKFSLAAAQHSENLQATGQPDNFTNRNDNAHNQHQYAGLQTLEGNHYQGYAPEYPQYYGGQQPIYSHQDVYEDDIGDLEDEGEEWFPDYANCECCKGFVNNCKGNPCMQMGECYCKVQRSAEKPVGASP